MGIGRHTKKAMRMKRIRAQETVEQRKNRLYRNQNNRKICYDIQLKEDIFNLYSIDTITSATETGQRSLEDNIGRVDLCNRKNKSSVEHIQGTDKTVELDKMEPLGDIALLKLAIKEEIEIQIAEANEETEVKAEKDLTTETNCESENVFENVIEIKQEITPDITTKLSLSVDKVNNLTDHTLANDETSFVSNDLDSHNVEIEIKQETNIDETIQEYQGVDSVSMHSEGCSIDSYEAAALGNVEACLQDEINIKLENYANFGDPEKVEYESDVKIEPNMSVSDLPQPCNGMSTILSNVDGLPKDIVVKLPPQRSNVERILPCDDIDTNTFQLNSITSDIPSLNEPGNEGNESFQLNSITGNILSLEQEAYGLLKAKRKKAGPTNKCYICPECPKTYTNKYSWMAHWDVHRSIERRNQGVQKGKITRQINKLKRSQNEIENNKLSCNNHESENKLKRRKHDSGNNKIKRSKHERGNKIKRNKYESELPNESNVNTEDNNVKPKYEGYECTCGTTFRRRSRMETCLRSHNMSEEAFNYVSCLTCTKSFKNKDELHMHRKRLHRKKFPCKFCPTDYNTRKELCKHLKIHQKVQLMDYKVISEFIKGNKKLKCFMCVKTFTVLTELKIHVMNDHKEPYVCPHCKNTFAKIIDFADHMKTYHPEVEGQSVLDVLEAFSKLVQAWKCQECDLQFLEADKLALHQLEKHSPESKTEAQFQCTDCRRVFISQKGLTSHRRVHHSIDPPEDSKEVEPGIMCLECRKICKDMQALTSHMRLHSPERKYPCKFCDFRFATPEKRKSHAEIHTGDMKYVCFICEYQCSSENRLKHHKMSLKHVNMREYLLTGKPLIEEPGSSKDKSNKKKDGGKKKKIEEVASETPNSEVSCDICGEQFTNENDMLEHKQTHPFIEFPNEDTPTRIFFK